MIIRNILLSSESYTYPNWVYRDVFVGFSRLYFIIDGEGYYEENGKIFKFKKNHLYLTPVKKYFSLYDNPESKLLHTYAHITTLPTVTDFTEIEVKEGTPLADAVALWRKYVHTEDKELLSHIIGLILACINKSYKPTNALAEKTKSFIDTLETSSFDMETLSRKLGYTREHITRNFLSFYNTTPKKYFNLRRMDIALTKLLGGARVKETADYLGFSSPYSFSKAFKAHFGLSPEKYLEILKNDKKQK